MSDTRVAHRNDLRQRGGRDAGIFFIQNQLQPSTGVRYALTGPATARTLRLGHRRPFPRSVPTGDGLSQVCL